MELFKLGFVLMSLTPIVFGNYFYDIVMPPQQRIFQGIFNKKINPFRQKVGDLIVLKLNLDRETMETDQEQAIQDGKIADLQSRLAEAEKKLTCKLSIE